MTELLMWEWNKIIPAILIVFLVSGFCGIFFYRLLGILLCDEFEHRNRR